MREVRVSEAKAHLTRLLDDVEHGETIIITRRGRRIARIVPDPERRRQEIKEAIENIRKIGKQVGKETGGATVEEIISSIHEGHKY